MNSNEYFQCLTLAGLYMLSILCVYAVLPCPPTHRLFNRRLLAVSRQPWYIRVAAAMAATQCSNSSSSSSNGVYSSNGSLLTPGCQQQQQQQRKSSGDGSFSSSSSSAVAPRCRPFGSWLLLLLLLVLRLLLGVWGLVRWVLVSLWGLVLMPVVGLALVAKHHPGPWRCLLAHGVYIILGPWFSAQLSSSSPGLGFWFHYGLLLPLRGSVPRIWETGAVGSAATAAGVGGGGDGGVFGDGGDDDTVWWGFVRSADARFICGLSMLGFLMPVTLWAGMVVQSWYLQAQAIGVYLDSSSNGKQRGSNDNGKQRGTVSRSGALECGKGADPWGLGNDSEDDVIVTAADESSGLTGARSGSLSNRQGQGLLGYGRARSAAAAAAAAAGDEEWQVVPIGDEEGEGDEGQSPFEGCCYNISQDDGDDMRLEMVPLKAQQQQQQQRRGRARLSKTSPPRRRKDSASAAASAADGDRGAAAGAAAAVAAADDSVSSSNSSSELLGRQRQQQQQQSGAAAVAAAAAAELLRGASQVLLLPVVNSLLPSSPTAPAQQQEQQQYASAAAAVPPRFWAHTAPGWFHRLPVLPRVLRCLQAGVLWVRAAVVLLQLAASAAALPSLPLLLLLSGPGLIWSKATWRMAAAYGPAGVLLSPVLGWLPVLLGGWLHVVQGQMGLVGGGWGCGGCCAKGMRKE
jgi:hypothetical protein